LWKTPWKVHGKRKTVIEGARHFDSETRGKTVYILVVDDDKFANDLVRFALIHQLRRNVTDASSTASLHTKISTTFTAFAA